MFYGPYKCKNKNEIQHFINMAILNEDYISNLSELMGVIKVDFFIFVKSCESNMMHKLNKMKMIQRQSM